MLKEPQGLGLILPSILIVTAVIVLNVLGHNSALDTPKAPTLNLYSKLAYYIQ